MSADVSNPDDLQLDPWLNRVLSERYRIVARIGAGGMGIVYRAWDEPDDRYVVIKTPRQEFTGDATLLKRFQKELLALRDLKYPAIVPVIDSGQEGDRPFAVMPYLAGGSLRQRRAQASKGTTTDLSGALWTWLPLIAQALDFVHGNNYVHRDVKPDNVLFNGLGMPFLGDFGVAKIVLQADEASQTRGLTGTGFALGTPEYMAPELIGGTKPDAKVDQYALAVMTYEWLAGRKPFDGPTPAAVIVAHASGIAPKLKAVRPDVPQTLSDAVMRGMSKDPKNRFESCAAFATAVLEEVPPPSAASKLQLMCPDCGRLLNVNRDWGGKRGNCPKCQSALSISTDLNSLWLEQDRRGRNVTPSSLPALPDSSSGAATASGKWISTGLTNISAGISRSPGLSRTLLNLLFLVAAIASIAATTHLFGTRVATKPQSVVTASASQVVPEKAASPTPDAGVTVTQNNDSQTGLDSNDVVNGDVTVRSEAKCVVLANPSGATPSSFAYLSPKYLACIYSNGTVAVRDCSTGTIVSEILVCAPGVRFPPPSIAWHSESSTLVVLGEVNASGASPKQTLVTAHRRFLEARCLERGFSLAQVMDCVVSQNGDIWTVDVEHPKYPRAPTGSAGPSSRHGLALLKWDESAATLSFLRRVESMATSPLGFNARSWSPDLTCCITSPLPRPATGGTVRSGTLVPPNTSMPPSPGLSVWLERPIEGTATELALLTDTTSTAGPTGVISSPNALLFSPDSSLCAIGVTRRGRTSVRLYETRTGDLVGDVSDKSRPVGPPLFFSHTGNIFAALSPAPPSMAIQLWGAPDWKHLGELPASSPSLSARGLISPDETQCFVAGNDLTAFLWTIAGNSVVRLDAHDNAITAACFSPDGRLLATGSRDSSIRLWTTPTGTEAAVLRGHKGDVAQIAFSPDGTCLASRAADAGIRVWQLDDAREPAPPVLRRWISTDTLSAPHGGPPEGGRQLRSDTADSGSSSSQEFAGPASSRTASASRANGEKMEISENSIGMKLVRIREGTFLMGSPPYEEGRHADENQVVVAITAPFWIGQTEVTRGQWGRVMNSQPWQPAGGDEGDDFAATFITWSDAIQFCEKLTDIEHKKGTLPEDEQYMLPTEAQWEYACRAGTSSCYYFGKTDHKLRDHAWFIGNARNVERVGQKTPNPWGLFDVYGNVAEWCRDKYVPGLPGGADPAPSGERTERVVRGGGWHWSSTGCRTALRHHDCDPTRRVESVGLRVVRAKAVVLPSQQPPSEQPPSEQPPSEQPPSEQPSFSSPREQLKAQQNKLREAQSLIESGNLEEAYQLLVQANDVAASLVLHAQLRPGLKALQMQATRIKQLLEEKRQNTTPCVIFSLPPDSPSPTQPQKRNELVDSTQAHPIFELVMKPTGLSNEILPLLPTPKEWAVMCTHISREARDEAHSGFVDRLKKRFPADRWSETDARFIATVNSELTALTDGRRTLKGYTLGVGPDSSEKVQKQIGHYWLLRSPTVDQFIARAKSAHPMHEPSVDDLNKWLISLGPAFSDSKKKQEALQAIVDAGVGFTGVKALLESF